MFRLTWIFHFVAVKFLDGRRLTTGGMVLSAKMCLKFDNAALNWSLMA